MRECHVVGCSRMADLRFFFRCDGKDRDVCTEHAATVVRTLFRQQGELGMVAVAEGFLEWQLTFNMEGYHDTGPGMVRPREVDDWLASEIEKDDEQRDDG